MVIEINDFVEQNVRKLLLTIENNTNDKLIYPTIHFIEDLRKEISNLVPYEIQKCDIISYDRFSKYIGKNSRYIRDIRNKINNSNNKKYNPNFLFVKNQLIGFLKDLNSCIAIIAKYILNNSILDYEHQQWHIHNPNLKVDFFKKLDKPIKGYYFGLLLGDGTSSENSLGIWIEKTDVKVIERYRIDLGISNKIETIIDTRQRKQSGDFPERKGIRLGCLPMIEDLKSLGFFKFKYGYSLEKGFFTSLKEDIALSVLLGFYDAEGELGTTNIHNTNKEFLNQIKNEFNIKNDLILKKKAKKGVLVWAQICDTVDQFYLRIEPELFNKMMESYEYSMERKRFYYPMKGSKYAFNRLVDRIPNKEALEELILIAPKTKLAEYFEYAWELFNRLCNEYNIKSLSHSYWKRKVNKNWRDNFNRNIEEFKKKFSVKGS